MRGQRKDGRVGVTYYEKETRAGPIVVRQKNMKDIRTVFVNIRDVVGKPSATRHGI